MIRQRITLNLITPFDGDTCVEVQRSEYSLGYPVYPQLFVCFKCRRVWAAIDTLESPTGPDSLAEVQGVSCLECFEPRDLVAPFPGSILDNATISTGGWDPELLAVLPPSLLAREFALHLKVFENELSLGYPFHEYGYSSATGFFSRAIPSPGV